MAQRVKYLPAMRETWDRSPGREDPLEKEIKTTPVLLPGKSEGLRTLVGYGIAESIQLSNFTFTLYTLSV